MDKDKPKSFISLYNELRPLVLKLAGTSNYRRLRFTFEDMEGMLYEKLLHVWNKYESSIPYEEVKAISITALHNYIGKIQRKYGKEVALPDGYMHEAIDLEDDSPDLLCLAKPYLSEAQYFVLQLLIEPPRFIESKVTRGTRIPSNIILEFLDYPTDKQSVKKLNTIRRGIFATLEDKLKYI